MLQQNKTALEHNHQKHRPFHNRILPWGAGVVVVGIMIGGIWYSGVLGNKSATANINPKYLSVPKLNQIKSMTEWSSSLPGAPHLTVTPASNSKEIGQVLAWLRGGTKIQPEPTQIGKGGYPPGIVLTLKNGDVFYLKPATNETVKPLEGATEIVTANATGYIDYESGNLKNKMPNLRIYDPKLYQWITSGWQKDSKMYPSVVTLKSIQFTKNSLNLVFAPGIMMQQQKPSFHLSSGSSEQFIITLHNTKSGNYTLNRTQPVNSAWAKTMVLRKQGDNLTLTINLKQQVSSPQMEVDGYSVFKFKFQ
jgi:hypothetical protein